MKIFIPTLVFCFWTILAFAQSDNPFDVQHTGGPAVVDSVSAPASGNIFDVSRTTAPSNIPSTYTAPSTQATETVPQPEVTPTPTSAEPPKASRLSSNPFEVDHVPIRRRDLPQAQAADSPQVKSQQQGHFFLFWITLLSIILIAVVINVRRQILGKIYRAITNENLLKFSKREENNGRSGSYLILYVVYLLSATSFAYLIAEHYGWGQGFWFWCKIGAGILAVYTIRHLAMWVMGLFFPFQKESSLYSFTIATFNLFIGIVLIPIVLFLAFGPESLFNPLLYVSMGLLGLLFLIRMARGLFIGLPYLSAQPLHFLLYLCCFEIAPFGAMFKMLNI